MSNHEGVTVAWGAWSGGPGVGARCGNGLFSTYKSPKFYLSSTILVSLILVKYPDKIGPVNTVGTSIDTVPGGTMKRQSTRTNVVSLHKMNQKVQAA